MSCSQLRSVSEYWKGKFSGLRLTASFDVDHVAILFLVPVEPDIRNKYVPVMRDKVLDDALRGFHNVHVPPVHPAMLRLQCSRK
jgi:hypothetical protein